MIALGFSLIVFFPFPFPVPFFFFLFFFFFPFSFSSFFPLDHPWR